MLREGLVPTMGPGRARLLGILRGPLGSSTTWSAGSRLATLVGLAVSSVVLARLLEAPALGAYFTVAAFVPIAAVVVQAGLDRTVVVRATSEQARGRSDEGKIQAGACVATSMAIGIVAAPIFTLAIWAVSRGIMDARIPFAGAAAAALWAAATGVRGVAAEAFRAFHRFGVASVYNGPVDALLLSGVLLALLIFNEPVGLNLSLAITAACVILAATWSLGHLTGFLPLRTSRNESRDLLRSSLPIMGASLSFFVLGSGVDVLIVSAVGTDTDVAYFGAAARLASLMVVMYGIVISAVPSLYVHLSTERDRDTLESLVRVAASIAALPSVVLAAIYIFAGQNVLGLVFGQGFQDGYLVLVLLSAGHLTTVLTGPSSLALTLSGLARIVLRSTAAVGCASLVLALALGWFWGGAAIAACTAVGVAVQNVWMLMAARAHLGLLTVPTLSRTRVRAALHDIAIARP